ncbi:MAG: hypothetical protein AABX30_02145 [Nanoarchaeota archaeon]
MWLEIFNFLHFIGLSFGLGGVTIATIISLKADKDKDVAKAFIKIMPAMVKIIWIGLVFLIISGIALPYFITWHLDKNMLLVKHVLFIWIVIFGITIGLNSRKMKKLMIIGEKEKPSLEFLRAKKRAKAFSIVNLILWYLVAIISVFI